MYISWKQDIKYQQGEQQETFSTGWKG